MNDITKLASMISSFEEWTLMGCRVKRKRSLPFNGDSTGRPPAPLVICPDAGCIGCGAYDIIVGNDELVSNKREG